VHHAVNERYVDKNYGGILIVWDRMFGTFEPEDDAEPCVYGTRTPLRSFSPVWANLHVYRDLVLDSWHARSWLDKLRIWLMPPGWRPADVATRFPKPAFDIARVERFDPPLDRATAWLAVALFALALGATCLFLWHVHRLSGGEQVAGALAIVGALWAIGALTQRGAGSARALPSASSPT
jgi:hypothetical protein